MNNSQVSAEDIITLSDGDDDEIQILQPQSQNREEDASKRFEAAVRAALRTIDSKTVGKIVLKMSKDVAAKQDDANPTAASPEVVIQENRRSDEDSIRIIDNVPPQKRQFTLANASQRMMMRNSSTPKRSVRPNTETPQEGMQPRWRH